MKLSRKKLTEKINSIEERFNFFENNIFFETIKNNVYIKVVDNSCNGSEVLFFIIFIPLEPSTQEHNIVGKAIYVSRNSNETKLELSTIFKRSIKIVNKHHLDIGYLHYFDIIEEEEMIAFFKNIEQI